MADDLVAFIEARLAEDEQIARVAMPAFGVEDGSDPLWPDYQTYGDEDIAVAYGFLCQFAPARMLREVEAKRCVLALHEPHEGRCTHCVQWCDDCENQIQCNHGNENRSWPCPTVRAIAEVYDMEMPPT